MTPAKPITAKIPVSFKGTVMLPIVVLSNETATLRARILLLRSNQTLAPDVAKAQLAPGINRPLQSACAGRRAERTTAQSRAVQTQRPLAHGASVQVSIATLAQIQKAIHRLETMS